jgi:hypothetical protein
MLPGKLHAIPRQQNSLLIPLSVIAAIVLVAPLSTPAENTARIYVYAQRLTSASSWLPISCGDVVVARLKRGTFFAINVDPGRYKLSIENGLPVFVEVRSGEASFVRLDWSFGIGRSPIPVLRTVASMQARKEMMNLSYISSNKVISTSVPKADPGEAPPLRLKSRDAR